MTTQNKTLNAFVLAAQEGRTRESLDILGEEVLVKLTNTDSDGAAAVFHLTVPPMSRPPLHRHSREDEWLYVLDGEVTAEIAAQGDNGTNFFTGFATGKVGMAGLGAFAIGLLKEKYPNINFDVAPLPGQNGGPASFAGGDSIGIPKGSKKVKEAWEFIQWCLQDDTQVNEFAEHGSIPVRTDIAESAYAKLDPRYVVVAKAMATGKTPYSTKYNELLNDPNGPWLGLVQSGVFGKGVDEAVKDERRKNSPRS